MAAEICTDVEAAARRRGAGVDVVLILAEGVAFSGGDAGPGRLAVFVADVADLADGSAAATAEVAVTATAMAADLWGA